MTTRDTSARQDPADKSTARTRMLLDGPIGATLFRLAAPNVVAMASTTLMAIAEGYFAGQLGVSALAGLALVFPLVMLTQMLSGGSMGGAYSASVARALGMGTPERAGRMAKTAYTLSLCAALLSALLMAAFGAGIFTLLGGTGATLNAALSYASVFFPGCVALWLCNTSASILRGTGNMAAPSIMLLCVSLFSIPLSGAFALGWGPFPAFGMAGLALGQILAFVAGTLVGVLLVLRVSGLPFSRARAPLTGKDIGTVLRLGAVASLSPLQTVLTVTVMVGIVGRYGADALAGYGVGARFEFLMVPIVFGIGSALTAMVGANIGAGQHDRALRIAWTGASAAAVLVGGIGILVSFFPDLWLGLFFSPEDSGALAAGRAYLRIVGPFYAFFAIGLALYFASQGASRVGWPVIGGFGRLIVAFGGALLLAQITTLGVNAVFVAIAGGMFTYGAINTIALWRSQWR